MRYYLGIRQNHSKKRQQSILEQEQENGLRQIKL